MGSTANTYLIAGGSMVAGTVGVAVTGFDVKVAGMMFMGAGIIAVVVGGVGHTRKRYTVSPLRRRIVTETGGARTWGAIAGQAAVTSDDVAWTSPL